MFSRSIFRWCNLLVGFSCGLALWSGSAAVADDKLGVAIPYGVDSLDPMSADDPVVAIVLNNLGVGLVNPEAGNSAEQSSLVLAESIQFDPNTNVTRGRLRDDLQFPSGGDITGQAFERSVRYYQSRNFSQTQALGAEPIAPAHGLNVFRIRSPHPSLVLSLPVVDTELLQQFGGKAWQGTLIPLVGPFTLTEARESSGYMLEKNQTFFQREEFRGPTFLEFKVFEDAATALSALRGGGIAVIAFPTAEMLQQIEGDSTVTIIPSPLKTMREERGWKLPRSEWSRKNDPRDRLLLDEIIIRKTLKTDRNFQNRFEFSGTYLP